MKNSIPSFGYLLELWNGEKPCIGYRSTALAYMDRENLTTVKHQNGNTYTIEEVKESIIGYSK